MVVADYSMKIHSAKLRRIAAQNPPNKRFNLLMDFGMMSAAITLKDYS